MQPSERRDPGRQPRPLSRTKLSWRGCRLTEMQERQTLDIFCIYRGTRPPGTRQTIARTWSDAAPLHSLRTHTLPFGGAALRSGPGILCHPTRHTYTRTFTCNHRYTLTRYPRWIRKTYHTSISLIHGPSARNHSTIGFQRGNIVKALYSNTF